MESKRYSEKSDNEYMERTCVEITLKCVLIPEKVLYSPRQLGARVSEAGVTLLMRGKKREPVQR